MTTFNQKVEAAAQLLRCMPAPFQSGYSANFICFEEPTSGFNTRVGKLICIYFNGEPQSMSVRMEYDTDQFDKPARRLPQIRALSPRLKKAPKKTVVNAYQCGSKIARGKRFRQVDFPTQI